MPWKIENCAVSQLEIQNITYKGKRTRLALNPLLAVLNIRRQEYVSRILKKKRKDQTLDFQTQPATVYMGRQRRDIFSHTVSNGKSISITKKLITENLRYVPNGRRQKATFDSLLTGLPKKSEKSTWIIGLAPAYMCSAIFT